MSELNFGKKKLGFGCMRLPMKEGSIGQEGEVDIPQMCKMIDRFMEEGFNYFDTAHGYVSEKSEPALKEVLTSRYPRESYILTDKLSGGYIKKQEDIRPYIENQLALTGAGYFDYYFFHALTSAEYQKFTQMDAFSIVKKFKEEGLIRHIGMSFHDTADVLDKILSEHPEIEVVQLQFNYVDFEDTGVQSRKNYEVCRKYNKPVTVMEPIKGGALVNLPENAQALFDAFRTGDSEKPDSKSLNASYALRFAASFEGIAVVLSGMSTLDQMESNISFMKDFQPLSTKEREAVDKAADILRHLDSIPCTACRYCVDGCPQHILIPDLFACRNAKKVFKDWNSDFYYGVYTGEGHGKAKDCIKCRKCVRSCPQHLEIPELLEEVSALYDK